MVTPQDVYRNKLDENRTAVRKERFELIYQVDDLCGIPIYKTIEDCGYDTNKIVKDLYT